MSYDALDMGAALLGGALLLLALMGAASATVLPGLKAWDRTFFRCYFVILLLNVVLGIVDLYHYRDPTKATLDSALCYAEILLSSVLIVMMTIYLLHSFGNDWRQSALLRWVAALWALFFVLLNVGQFTQWFYYYTPDNQFVRGSWFPVLMAPMVVITALNLLAVLRRRSKLTPARYRTLLTLVAPLLIAMCVHTVVASYFLFDTSMTLASLAMFGGIVLERIDQHLGQQREIANQRANIMVLQMRPHFIYNTMTSIYYLCEQDAKKAQQVTLDFTSYLRKNFTAIASDRPVPFTDELEHARAYLAVEMAQHDGFLFVDYDTPHTDFHVPPLTLQPLVENCVKHGMDPNADSFHIAVRTRQTEEGSVILVEDDGTGFELTHNSEPHVALSNIRQRLELMCGGTLTISLREGGGTVVRVTIPKAHTAAA